jgi:hypothetical protein
MAALCFAHVREKLRVNCEVGKECLNIAALWLAVERKLAEINRHLSDIYCLSLEDSWQHHVNQKRGRWLTSSERWLYSSHFRQKKLPSYWYDVFSSVGIATRFGLDSPGSNPGGDEIFHTCPDRPCSPPSLLYKGYRVFPGVKAAGAWRWQSTPI